MAKIHVNLGDDSYDILIERGLIDKVGPMIKELTDADRVANSTQLNSIRHCMQLRIWLSVSSPYRKAKPARHSVYSVQYMMRLPPSALTAAMPLSDLAVVP